MLYLKVFQFLANEDGPTAVEYAVMLALIIAVLLSAVQALGQNTNAVFNNSSMNETLERPGRHG